MKVDNCGISACMSLTAPQAPNGFLNVNSPMQIGGTLTNLAQLASELGWDYIPTERGFVGCIRNMTFNGNVTLQKFFLIFPLSFPFNTFAVYNYERQHVKEEAF